MDGAETVVAAAASIGGSPFHKTETNFILCWLPPGRQGHCRSVTARTKAKDKRQRDPEALLRASKEPDFRQERSRRSYLALIEAATELFSAHGYDAVGTPEIAQRAKVSVGTFYRYFDDKHEVYLEICRRNMIAAYRETIEGLGPDRFVGRARHET